ncbi:MAG TPA: hypothetical protein VFY06_05610 [Verrucomicrobiae bacterium]|nr:hypothetical protein [Verrucomicrobiae bacterium]
MSNIVTSKFGGLLRGLFRRYDDNGGAATMVASPRHAAAIATTPARAASLSPAPARHSQPQMDPAPSRAGSNGLQLPLPSIIAVLPIDLRAKLLEAPPSDAMISIPVDKVLSQLAHGSVKMTFGELRAATPGLFASSGTENDVRQIALPLNEIITRISPTLLSRRDAKKVEAADDIAGPFGNHAPENHLTAVKPSAPATTATPGKPPGTRPLPAMARPASLPISPAQKSALVSASSAPIAPRPAETKIKFSPAPVEPVAAKPLPAPAATIPLSARPAAVAAQDSSTASQTPDEHPILAPLSALAEKWPEAIKMELASAELIGAQAALPRSLIEPGLKRGRVTIQWQDLRRMFRPKPASDSPNDLVEVELPLNVLAPLFFASQKSGDNKKHNQFVGEEIPDLFHSTKQKEAATSFTPETNAAPASSIVAEPSVPSISAAPAAPVSPPVSAPPAANVAPATADQGTLLAPLEALMEKWPEPLRQEITQWNLPQAQIALPLNLLGPAMKRGRVLFAWRDLRSWAQPAPAVAGSVHDDIELELPLKVVAPLFLGQQNAPASTHSRITVDQSIPSPFSSVATPETTTPIVTPFVAPAAAPTPNPASQAPKPLDTRLSETNFYVWGDASDTPSVDKSEYKRAQAPATDFTSRKATPKEIVARAMNLPGVAGVVVALCDGLTIASQVPQDLNADTAAAFLPQIFDRVAQCTRELRMGVLNNLKFTVGNVPWHIFHVNAIYFAAFGHAGESLPTAQLASLAGELDRKKQP